MRTTPPSKRVAAVTVADIARHAGVSRQTAGYIVNGQGNLFRPETRRRVLASCRALGYRPNAGARAIRTGRFDAVGLCASSNNWLTNVSERLLGGIHDRLAALDRHLVFARLPEEAPTAKNPVPRVLKHMMVDGLLISYTHDIPATLLRLINAGPIPTIWINSLLDGNCVLPDDADAGRRATARLLDQGHRRIAFAAFNIAPRTTTHAGGHFSVRERYRGYVEAMRAAGLTPRLLPSLAKGVVAEYPAVDLSFLRGANAPTAIVSYSQYGLTDLLVTARLQTPRHIPTLTLFEDAPTWVAGTPLDSWIVPWREIGSAAVDHLLLRIESAGAPTPIHRVPFAFAPAVPNRPPPRA